MSALQSEDCQTNDLNESSNDLFPMCIESLRFPLDNSMRIVFTGYFNGYNVEVRSTEEMEMLYHMGCFGKGSASRSRPTQSHRDDTVTIMRKRQFQKRNYWYKKFDSSKGMTDSDLFLKEVEEVSAKIHAHYTKRVNKDVIDLVSSDESSDDEGDDNKDDNKTIDVHDKDDVIVIVPNSDSEEDNYFAKIKPKCCINKIKIQEKLILTLQEAFFLLYGLGCLQIISTDNNILSIEQCWDLFKYTDERFILKYVVYHYFRSKGLIVKPGIKFGGDYLLYKEGPGIAHADYIVVIKDNEIKADWISITGHVRMANTTVKEILLVEVISPHNHSETIESLHNYSVKETLLTRNIPVAINND